MSRTETVAAFDKGFYDLEGFSRPDLERYFVRWDDTTQPSERTRAFYAFDMSGLVLGEDDTIEVVRLSLFLPDGGFLSPNPAERMSFHVVQHDLFDRILAGGRQGEEVFGALTSGERVGQTIVRREEENSFVTAVLADSMRRVVDDARVAADTRLLIGGKLEPYGAERGDRKLFRLTDEDDPIRLEIEVDDF